MEREADVALGNLLRAMSRKAESLGCTRLADITRLDRIGLPVFQAIRPASRALSVHQGKGDTPYAARLSALGEAIESGVAENLTADGVVADYDAKMRAGEAIDIERLRQGRLAMDPERIEVCSMQDAHSGRDILVPHPILSMDFTLPNPAGFERSSNGLGLGVNFEQAASKAAFECIERDAVGRWLRLPRLFREGHALALASLPSGWGSPWTETLAEMDIVTRVYAVSTLTGAPCFFCSLIPGPRTTPRAPPTHGSACGADAAGTLRAALLEAIQSRLTIISGARDDILHGHYAGSPAPSRLVAQRPGDRRWNRLALIESDWHEHVERLVRKGVLLFTRRLTVPSDPLTVVKALAPRLGSLSRQRAAAA